MRTENGCTVGQTVWSIGHKETAWESLHPLAHGNSSSICPLPYHDSLCLPDHIQMDGPIYSVCWAEQVLAEKELKHAFRFTPRPQFMLLLLYPRTQPFGFCFLPTTDKSCVFLNIKYKLNERNWKIKGKIPTGKKHWNTISLKLSNLNIKSREKLAFLPHAILYLLGR